MSFDCFISYAARDLAHAQALHDRLVQEGFSVWFDKARLREGCDWHKEIEAGCEASRVVLPVLTPTWKATEWTRYETYGAETVIPVVAEGAWSEVATPPLTRAQIHAVPLAGRSEEEWQRLFTAVREALAQEAPKKAERVAHLRFRANPYFVGRDASLDEIHEKLFTNPTAALTQGHVGAITALGGVGKSTLARQYAEKFWRCYQQMFWVDCRRSLEGEFAAIHDLLRPDPRYLELKDVDKAAWVRSELNQTARRLRLLILDNAEDEESVLTWIPKTGNCHTIITSRYAAWSAGIETCPVWVLEPEPARQLLLRRSGHSNPDAAETEACDMLAGKLEYLPLALEQAAAYVGEQGPGYSFVAYVRLHQTQEEKFLARQTPGSTEYPASVLLTWRATVDKLPAGARAILRLCSFMASTPIPEGMLIEGRAIVGEQAKQMASISTPASTQVDEAEVREWKAALARYSMVKLEAGQAFSIHGLVQAVERHQMAAEEQPRVIESAMDLLMSWSPGNALEFENWKAWRVLLPHARQLWHWQQLRDSVRFNPYFLNELGGFLESQGAYAEAEPVLRVALEAGERSLGAEHSDVLSFLHNLAEFLYRKGDYSAAEPLYRRALEVRQRVLGPEHADTLTSLAGLAFLLFSKGDFATAEPLMRRALEACERVFGREHRNTLSSLNNLAMLLSTKGDYAAAEPLHRRELEACERLLGPEHPHTLLSVTNLAGLLYSKGDYAAAEPLMRRALEAQERVLGPEHPNTLLSVTILAMLLYSKGDYGAAEPLMRRSLEARERVLGPKHPDTLLSVNNLAVLLFGKGDYAAAEPLMRRAIEVNEHVLGPEHPNTLFNINNLATLLLNERDYVAAEPLYRRVLEAQERVLGPEHPNTLRSLNNLASLLESKGDYAAAEPLYRRALEAQERVLGPEHPDTLHSVNNLAVLLFGKGDYATAEPLLRRALEARERVLGPEHPDTLTSINDLAELFRSKGDYAAAEPLFRRALEGHARVLGRKHPNTLIIAQSLEQLHKEQLLTQTGREENPPRSAPGSDSFGRI